MGDLRGNLPSRKMAAMFVVVLLAIATTCQGAALDRVKRDAIVGKMDKTFDFLGVHMGLKYKDAAQPLKGGKIQLKVDDLKKIFPQAHSSKVEVDAEFDGGVSMDDGLFKMVVHYSMVHSDGEGEEKGEAMIERKQTGDVWTTTIKTSAGAFGGKTIIPEAINNLEIMVESDRQTKLHAKYVNPTKNRDMHINIDRVPGQSLHLEIVNGDRKHDLTFKVGDLNFRKMDGIFNVAVEGTSLGEAVKGELKGSRTKGVQVLQFELEKGNKKYIQIETKIKMDGLNIETRTKYAVLGGTIAGKVLLKLENGAFKTRNNKVTIFVNKKNKNLLAPKFKLEVQLQKDGEKVVDLTADTTGSPYVLKLTAPNFFKRWGIEQPSIDITIAKSVGIISEGMETVEDIA